MPVFQPIEGCLSESIWRSLGDDTVGCCNGIGSRFFILPIATTNCVMNTTYQINRESAPIEALATAAAKALLTFAKIAISTSVNTLLALVAVMQLFAWILSDGQAGNPAPWCIAWVLHFALISAIDIKKGGVK